MFRRDGVWHQVVAQFLTNALPEMFALLGDLTRVDAVLFVLNQLADFFAVRDELEGHISLVTSGGLDDHGRAAEVRRREFALERHAEHLLDRHTLAQLTRD